MTYSILGRAAIAVGLTALLAATAQAQGGGKAAPRLVLGDARALIIFPPVTGAKLQPITREIPKTLPKPGPRPATSFRPIPWPEKAAMFKQAGVVVLTEDSSSMFALEWAGQITPQGALFGNIRADGYVAASAQVTVGVDGRYAREHPSLQFHFHVKNLSMYAWTVHNLVDGSDIEIPAKPKMPVDIAVLVNVPADFISDDHPDVIYSILSISVTHDGPWYFQRVDVIPISTRSVGQGT